MLINGDTGYILLLLLLSPPLSLLLLLLLPLSPLLLLLSKAPCQLPLVDTSAVPLMSPISPTWSAFSAPSSSSNNRAGSVLSASCDQGDSWIKCTRLTSCRCAAVSVSATSLSSSTSIAALLGIRAVMPPVTDCARVN